MAAFQKKRKRTEEERVSGEGEGGGGLKKTIQPVVFILVTLNDKKPLASYSQINVTSAGPFSKIQEEIFPPKHKRVDCWK